jgi:hypothetical protein
MHSAGSLKHLTFKSSLITRSCRVQVQPSVLAQTECPTHPKHRSDRVLPRKVFCYDPIAAIHTVGLTRKTFVCSTPRHGTARRAIKFSFFAIMNKRKHVNEGDAHEDVASDGKQVPEQVSLRIKFLMLHVALTGWPSRKTPKSRRSHPCSSDWLVHHQRC